jgi:hypothetical protein
VLFIKRTDFTLTHDHILFLACFPLNIRQLVSKHVSNRLMGINVIISSKSVAPGVIGISVVMSRQSSSWSYGY